MVLRAMLVIAVVTALLNLASAREPDQSVRVLIGLGLTAGVVAALMYLVAERCLRPAFRRGLHELRGSGGAAGVRRRLQLAWPLGSGVPAARGPPQPDHAERALRAARQLRDRLSLPAAIGVATGVAVAGNIGTESRYEYTVIGPPVNEAARLTERAKTVPERLLASGETVRAAGAEPDWIHVETTTLRGLTSATDVFAPTPPTAPTRRPA